MFFSSLEDILTEIEHQPGWEKYQQYRQLLEYWQRIVSEKIAQHTRPLYINRQVLWVATSSSVWAQELSLQRYTLLVQLNNPLPFSLKDIRFSSTQWKQTRDNDVSTDDVNNQQSLHPSRIKLNTSEITLANSSSVGDPQKTVKYWLSVLKKRSLNLSICPQCQSPTPEGELKRWHLCCHCMAQKWSEKH